MVYSGEISATVLILGPSPRLPRQHPLRGDGAPGSEIYYEITSAGNVTALKKEKVQKTQNRGEQI